MGLIEWKISMTEEASSPTYHVLALSGGGYRGLYTATILKELESTLGHPLARHFDLICGTSVGGLLAMGLSLEIPTMELQGIFKNHGDAIFNSRQGIRRLLGFWGMAKHSNEGLKSVLSPYFDGKTIGDLKHATLITSVNYATGAGQFFKTPHHPNFRLDHSIELMDVALATSAAPAYFPIVRNSRGVFADGGLVGNAPGLFGWHEVTTFLDSTKSARIRVLAIGTMSTGATIRGNAKLDAGILNWRGDLLSLMFSAQESSVDHMLRHILKNDYFKIDDPVTPDQSEDIKKLDVVSEAATHTLVARGVAAAQRTLGHSHFQPFIRHIAAKPDFYYGPNKNREPESA